MLDLKLIRSDPEGVRAALIRRGPAATATLEEVIAGEIDRRALIGRVEEARAARNAASQEIAELKRRGEDGERAIARQREVGAAEKELSRQLAIVEARLVQLAATLPNLPDPSAADGPDDEVVKEIGRPRQLSFKARDHLELAGEMIDMERGARVAGSRFAYLMGDLVMVEIALVGWVLEKVRSHGFQPVIPPVLVRERALYGTGFLPDTEQQIYRVDEDDLYLVGTSEVALASLHDSEILDEARLPLRYAGYSPCFRREAGAAGRDTRGIFRVHQFEKVEMFSFVLAEDSPREHERVLTIEEEILSELELPYRVVNIAVGDLGNSAAKKYDCEVWLPSQERYRELTSTSNTTDYQARRLNIRVRRKATEMVHTVNGTAVAVGRTLIALLENGQQEDGSVVLPSCLAQRGAPEHLRAAR